MENIKEYFEGVEITKEYDGYYYQIDYVQDPALRKTMDQCVQKEKNRGRVETRTAFTTDDVSWLPGKRK